MKEPKHTPEQIRQYFHYDPDTGIITWKVHKGRHGKPGKVAGSLRTDGYYRVKLDQREYTAQNIAWVIMTGEWPTDFTVDHKDRDPLNNAWDNLREADECQNKFNRRGWGKLGLKGVSLHKGKYRAQIMAHGVYRHLGYFDCPRQAHEAYRKAAQELHGEFACAA